MKNIQVITGADNCVYDIFAATDDEFAQIFSNNTDIAFIEELLSNEQAESQLDPIFGKIWRRRLRKQDAQGIHGIVFFGLLDKRQYYPTLKDEEAINPDGSLLRADQGKTGTRT